MRCLLVCVAVVVDVNAPAICYGKMPFQLGLCKLGFLQCDYVCAKAFQKLQQRDAVVPPEYGFEAVDLGDEKLGESDGQAASVCRCCYRTYIVRHDIGHADGLATSSLLCHSLHFRK